MRSTAAVNAVRLIGGSIAARLASLAMYAAMARLLGRRGFGEFVLALAIAFLLTVDLGLDMVVARLVARDRREIVPAYPSAMALKLAIAAVGLMAAAAIAVFAPLSPNVRIALAFLFPAASADLIAKTNYAVLEGLGDQRPRAVITTTQRVVAAAIAIGVMAAGAGIAGAASAYLAASVAGLFFSSRALTGVVGRLGRQVSRRVVGALVHASLPLAVAAGLETMTMRIDVVLVSHFKGAVAVGLFGAASQLFDGAVFIAWGIADATLPVLAKAASTRDAGRVYGYSVKAANAVLFPIGVALMAVPRPVIDVIYGSRFHAGSIAVRLIGAAIALYGIDFVSWTALIARGRSRVAPWVVGGWAISNIFLCLLLVPRYSFRGAAWAFLIGQAFHTTMTVGVTMRQVTGVAWMRALLGPTLACLPLATLALAGAPEIIALSAGVACYPPLLFMLERGMYPDDLQLIRRQLPPGPLSKR